jgi:hypothetical protein
LVLRIQSGRGGIVIATIPPQGGIPLSSSSFYEEKIPWQWFFVGGVPASFCGFLSYLMFACRGKFLSPHLATLEAAFATYSS